MELQQIWSVTENRKYTFHAFINLDIITCVTANLNYYDRFQAANPFVLTLTLTIKHRPNKFESLVFETVLQNPSDIKLV